MNEPSRHSRRTSFVGNLIREDREQAGLNLNQYAAAVGVSRTYVSRLERGIYDNPSPDVLVRIAKARPISLADLFVGSGYTVPDELPSIVSCVRTQHPDWPEAAFDEIAAFYDYLEHRYGAHERRN
jgi:transcriptional regulator with XRE-family HTH domain